MTVDEFVAAVRQMAREVAPQRRYDDVRVVLDFDRRTGQLRQVMVQHTERDVIVPR